MPVIDLRLFGRTSRPLASLDLSTFNTAKVTDMHSLFYHNYVLSSLKMSPNFTLDVVTNDFGEIFVGTGSHLNKQNPGIIYG